MSSPSTATKQTSVPTPALRHCVQRQGPASIGGWQRWRRPGRQRYMVPLGLPCSATFRCSATCARSNTVISLTPSRSVAFLLLSIKLPLLDTSTLLRRSVLRLHRLINFIISTRPPSWHISTGRYRTILRRHAASVLFPAAACNCIFHSNMLAKYHNEPLVNNVLDAKARE